MKITFIGTGSAFNHDYGNNSAFLEFGNTNLLLDCGHDVPKNFETLYGKVSNIDNIWISHMHGDHIGGLEEIAFKNKFMNNGKMVNLFVDHSMVDDLIVYLQMTIVRRSVGLSRVIDFFNIHEIVNDFTINTECGGEEFFTQRVEHICNLPAFAIIGKKFVFTGDTSHVWRYDWYYKLIKSGREHIFHDTQLQKFSKDDVHISLPDLLELPENIRSKIYCMHYGDNILDYEKTIGDAGMHIVRPGDIFNL